MIKMMLIIIVAELLACMGHILFKKSTNAIELQSLKTLDAYAGFMKKVFSKPSIWTGILLMAASLLVWIAALGEGPVSVVYSIGSIQYILILFLAPVFLDEKIDKMKFLGTVLVMAGIVLITIS